MMPGQWVTREDGTHWEVQAMIASRINAAGGIPVATTLYILRSPTGERAEVHQWSRSTRNAKMLNRTPERLTPYRPEETSSAS